MSDPFFPIGMGNLRPFALDGTFVGTTPNPNILAAMSRKKVPQAVSRAKRAEHGRLA